jgi:Tol biopolymer transport system component
MKLRDRALSFIFIGFLLFLGLSLSGALPLAEGQQEIVVSSADPPAAPQGTINLNVTIKGKGFKKGAQASFFVTGTEKPDGVRVNSTTFISPGELRANIDVTDSATVASYDIQVANSDGRTGKGIELFTVTSKGPKSEPEPDPAITYVDSGRVMVMNADGTNQRVVWSRGTSYNPDFSPDGRRLVFANDEGKPGTGSISIIGVDGSGFCNLVELKAPRGWATTARSAWPAWSPPLADGKEWIAYAGYDRDLAQSDLYAVRADCAAPGTPVKLTDDAIQQAQPSWSHLGTRFAAQVNEPNRYGVFIFDVVFVKGVPQLANPRDVRQFGLQWGSGAPSWAKNDDRLVFSSGSSLDEGSFLWITDLTAAGTSQITFHTGAQGVAAEIHWYASFSPTDQEMVVTYNNGSGRSVWKLRYVSNPDGTGRWEWTQQLLPTSFGSWEPRWRRCDPCR